MTRRALVGLAVFVAALVPLAGCGDGKKLYPVTGKVSYKGAAPKGAMVVFHPRGDNSPQAVRPSGVVKEDGTYTLYSGPGDEGKGAPPGEYDVAITWDVPKGQPKGMGGEEVKETNDQFGGRYKDYTKSGLKATVNAAPTEVPVFDLK